MFCVRNEYASTLALEQGSSIQAFILTVKDFLNHFLDLINAIIEDGKLPINVAFSY
jgi:hypothetical protein